MFRYLPGSVEVGGGSGMATKFPVTTGADQSNSLNSGSFFFYISGPT